MTQENLKIIQTIMRGSRIGLIACKIAESLSISHIEALRKFYHSETCRKFHDRRTGLYLVGDNYIVQEFLSEID